MGANSYTEHLKEEAQYNSQETLRSIITSIQSDRREILWPDEEGWVQFIKDHRKQIMEKSTEVYIDPNDARIYAYSVESFLKSKDLPISMAWIVVWLNQLYSSLHFSADMTTLYMPDIYQLQQYRQQYVTNRVLYRKALGTADV